MGLCGGIIHDGSGFLGLREQLATVSGETILPFFRTALSIADKGGRGSFDPVTAADHAAETAMRNLIHRTFPGHGIIGEEFGSERARPNMSGCSTRSTAPNRSFPACPPGER